jgi:hypothetical protein
MHSPTRLLFAAALCTLSACSTSKDLEEPLDDRHPTITETAPVPQVTGQGERLVIRDQAKRIRVDGRTDGGRMQGLFVYFDSKGDQLARVTYHLDQRHGPAQLYYVNADGPAVGRTRSLGTYSNGAPTGMIVSHWPGGAKKMERDFDEGILQGARGWRENGQRMTDGEAMKAAIQESRDEDALLTELENFVMLQVRKTQKKADDVVPDTDLEPRPSLTPSLTPEISAPYSGGTTPLTGS